MVFISPVYLLFVLLLLLLQLTHTLVLSKGLGRQNKKSITEGRSHKHAASHPLNSILPFSSSTDRLNLDISHSINSDSNGEADINIDTDTDTDHRNLLTQSNVPFTTWPPCSQVILNSYGMVDIGAMIQNCSRTAPSPLSPPSYFVIGNAGTNPVNVTVQLALNNLINVDDLTNGITMDFYFRLTWTDPRITMPNNFWSYLPAPVFTDGIVASTYGFTDLFWLVLYLIWL